MTKGYTFDPVQIAQELTDFNRKIASGVDILSHLESIDVGHTSCDEVFQDHLVKLLHYQPRAAPSSKTPLLIVFALVNRPYVLDLQPDRSFIKHLLDQGIDVYLIDWGSPERSDRYLSLDDYINGFLRRAIKHICAHHHISAINLMGVCQGGTFSLAYSAINPNRVNNLITLNTPVDFHSPQNAMTHLIRHVKIDDLVESYGNIPGEMVSTFFLGTNPFRTISRKMLDFVDNLDDREATLFFLRMNKWIYDCPDQAGESFKQFAKELIQQNQLINNEWKIGKERVNLSRIETPILNIHSTDDEIVPYGSSATLNQLVSTTDFTQYDYEGGHTGILVSKKAQKELPSLISKWLSERDTINPAS